MAKQSRSRSIIRGVGEEMRDRPPRQLARTRRKYGAKRAAKQRTAILLNKARRAGARIPRKRRRAARRRRG